LTIFHPPFIDSCRAGIRIGRNFALSDSMDNNSTIIYLPGVQIKRPSGCVLVIRYDDELNVTLEIAKQITLEVAKFFGETELGVVHSAGTLTTIEPGVREYLAGNSRYAHKIAEAFVVKNLGQRILANFHLRIVRPACPTEVFTTEEEAVKWVKMYCRNTDAENKCAETAQLTA
jgi:hypothetical protein